MNYTCAWERTFDTHLKDLPLWFQRRVRVLPWPRPAAHLDLGCCVRPPQASGS